MPRAARRVALLLTLALAARGAGAQPVDEGGQRAERQASFDSTPMDFSIPTLGGKHFWADQLVLHDWRIQRNVFTGHSRLLDPRDRRVVSGGFDDCRDRLASIREADGLPAMRPRTVVLLHGLWRSRGAMQKLQERLRENDAWSVISVEYPSTRATVGDHARGLQQVIDNLDGVEQLDFVCHSLGNLVVRRWLTDYYLPAEGDADRPRLGRMVMLGPPNHPPAIARTVIPLDVTRQVYGPSGRELYSGWDELAPTLAVPPMEFGILAGGNEGGGRNPLIPGDDDLVVSVDETRLAGAADFRVLPVLHTLMMRDPTLHQMTETFLLNGWFESADARQPIGP